ncbi:MAG: HigA family addiction module antidote protein [Anaerolineales bacterium]|nr:HigA family addiction module antidote protein [Anaerolineales bacterium]
MNEFRPDYVSLPGETLLEVLESLDMSQAELARRMGRPKKTINEIIQGKAAITPETSLQLEFVLGVPASFWNNRERQYQENKARIEEEEQLEGQVGWLQEMQIPIKSMCDMGWIEQKADKISQLREALRFYGVASVKQWQVVYAAPDALFRQSTAWPVQWGAVTAWLRKGELDAQVIDCQSYDAGKFRQTLQEIRNLTQQPVKNIWPNVVNQCAEAGVAVVLTPAFPNTGISGATRWLSTNKAILQLSLRYKRDDQLWFSFFHEAGHILRHGKKNLYLEPDERPKNIDKQELEANKFAADLLIPPLALREFVAKHARKHYSAKGVVQFAESLGIAPGIVVGRLHHDKELPPTHLNKLRQKLEWGEWTTAIV